MRLHPVCLGVVGASFTLALLAAAPAHAAVDDRAPVEAGVPGTPGADTTGKTPVRRGVLPHTHQLGLALMPGTGYRVIVPYEENVVCGDGDQDSRRVCAQRSPFFLELQLSYGVSGRLDLITDFRFGIEGEPITGHHQLAVAPGFRFWIDNDRQVKFYTTVQGVFDSTKQNDPRVSSTDFGLRNANGLMYDVIENVGLFAQFGETIGVKRWFRIDVDVGVGVQVRYP